MVTGHSALDHFLFDLPPVRPADRRGPGGVLTVPLGQLGLSAEQRDAVRGVLEEGREALREAGEQARASRQALRDAVGTGGDVDEDAIRAAAAGLGTAPGAMALARASARTRIWEVLTPDQRTAADVLRAAREQRMEARRERFEERRERWEERRDQRQGSCGCSHVAERVVERRFRPEPSKRLADQASTCSRDTPLVVCPRNDLAVARTSPNGSSNGDSGPNRRNASQIKRQLVQGTHH